VLRVLDLFSGIGGFSLGLERAGGFRTIAFCEIDAWCRRLLKQHWSNVPQLEDVTKIGIEPMSSSADSHAKTSATPGNAPELPGPVPLSGGGCAVPFAWYDRNTRSWRTWQRCLIEEWTRFVGTWPRSGMTRNGIAYQLPVLVPLTDETAFGLWPTPEASNAAAGDARKEIYYLPSGRPRGLSNSGIDGSIGLARMARLFPTPSVADARSTRNSTARRLGQTPSGVHAGDTLTDAVVPPGGALNPTWVEWLMGFPAGWTELPPSETPSSRRSRKSSGGRS
jgi:hypothetical protein